ncbi:MAG: flagellar assembly protein FliW [Nitrospirae bacterium]|nr:flagellar assembly protein FliW [Nitrospirota bacterium]MBF0541183.1 flagellar assembly protein FliW [Nitrospirota bacterium]
MITFETSRFGTLEVAENKVIQFPEGLLGFPEINRYCLIDYKDTPLKWLQAIDDPHIAFIVADPKLFAPDFELPIDYETKQTLEIADDEDLAILVTVRVENEIVIANFNGPILLNASIMRGMQIVVETTTT